MAVDKDSTESSISSSSPNSVETGQSGTALSPEDIAWADSCLSKDPLMLENGWNSLKDALLETLPEPDSSSEAKDNSTPEGAEVGAFPSTSGEDISGNSNSDTDDFWSRNRMNVFLPTYNENSKDLGVSNNPEVEFVFKESDLEQLTQDIFKVWDLDIPSEEDELVIQLKKALSESGLEQESSVVDDSEEWKCLDDEPLDALISGLADLTLEKNSTTVDDDIESLP